MNKEEIEAIEAVHGKMTTPDPDNCNRCNYDDHTCPGCGQWLYHGTYVCGDCQRENSEGA